MNNDTHEDSKLNLAQHVDLPDAAEAPELDQRIQLAIGRVLQSHFDDLVQAPIPDRFLVLLAELEAMEMRHER
jgi:hypothetical protein